MKARFFRIGVDAPAEVIRDVVGMTGATVRLFTLPRGLGWLLFVRIDGKHDLMRSDHRATFNEARAWFRLDYVCKSLGAFPV